MDLSTYRDRWSALAAQWKELRTEDEQAATELLRGVLADGLPEPDRNPLDAGHQTATLVECETALVELSGRFDVDGYLAADPENRRLQSGDVSPVSYFCEAGWRWLRNPSRDFDTWWYWSEYLDPTAEDINPFVHFLVAGERAGLRALPPQAPERGSGPTATSSTRRICLFAAYDLDGIVDDYVIAYLRELSRHADIYYLADGTMDDEELAKLADVTMGAWATPHGRYDFGSFALLAAEYVGWDIIDQYDELLLANDSCYLLRPLDEVFAKMADVPADWWGLQATKRDYASQYGHDSPIPLAEAKELHTDAERWSPYYRLHLSSYFLLARKRVMQDEGFRARLGAAVKQSHKGLVILKYEIGLSDYLLRSGYDCETFIPELYPFHPLWTADYSKLLKSGFPLLKRNLMSENPRRMPDVHRWREIVLAEVPDAPVEMFDRNLQRVAADDRLTASFAIRTRPDGTIDEHAPLSNRGFRRLDRSTPKFDHWWAFPVCAYNHTFAGNERAVFEEVRDDPSIKKIILTRSRAVEVTGENTVVVPLKSPEGQQYLARSRHIFVKHGPTINAYWPISTVAHNVINLWHGIPLKRFGTAAVELAANQYAGVIRNNGGSRAVIASSRMDAMAITAAFHPLPYPAVWQTGLPRNDFVVREDDLLPADLRAAADRLREEVAGRHLVLFLPTFKDAQEDAYYQFSEDDIAALRQWAEQHNAVIGVREHMADSARAYSHMLAPLKPINVSSRRYPDLEVLYRVADALISDYSSCLVDFMMTGKPVISFAYDYERYASAERGLFYELDRVLPGAVCRSFAELEKALHGVFQERTAEEVEEYDWRRRFFFDHLDDRSAWRVVQKVKALYR